MRCDFRLYCQYNKVDNRTPICKLRFCFVLSSSNVVYDIRTYRKKLGCTYVPIELSNSWLTSIRDPNISCFGSYTTSYIVAAQYEPMKQIAIAQQILKCS